MKNNIIKSEDVLNNYQSLNKEFIKPERIFNELEDVTIVELNSKQEENLILFCKDFRKKLIPLYVELWKKDYADKDDITCYYDNIRAFLAILNDKRLKKLNKIVIRKYINSKYY